MRAASAVAIRPATEHDLPAILAIYNDAVATTTASWDWHPTTLDERRGWLAQRQAAAMPVLVAWEAGAVQGFASCGPFNTRDGYLHTVEHSVYVDAGARGRGIGRCLLDALIAAARAQGRHAMIGLIEAGNAASIHLHQAAGFREVGRLPEIGWKFERWLDLVLMQLLLDGQISAAPTGRRY